MLADTDDDDDDNKDVYTDEDVDVIGPGVNGGNLLDESSVSVGNKDGVEPCGAALGMLLVSRRTSRGSVDCGLQVPVTATTALLVDMP